ncbi:hypothetical protein ALC60_09489 [Trachymyrmex zeteki]|uniref:Double jelly roll-like domain-containing protein n=1 Tax=Mycetomoellerius zeteki TaxID=64791 RepID=A0A151WU26_9HYME|nr:hypothetical protein ALC60_09489 [Trachymyrmex zeteki]
MYALRVQGKKDTKKAKGVKSSVVAKSITFSCIRSKLHEVYTISETKIAFSKAYYGIDCFETLLNVLSFIEKGPFAVIDCLRQNESVKSATVDVRIEFDCKENVPANTIAYCLIIHDRVIEYSPLSNVVRKIM